MTNSITKPERHRWKEGESGNPKGRPRKNRALSAVLMVAMEESAVIGGEELTGKEAMARLIREFVLHGEVWLNGRRLAAESVMEWLLAVKWLYEQVDGKAPDIANEPAEMVIQVIRDDSN